jgi:hypothetical protein
MTQFLTGTQLMSVTFDHTMLFEVYAPVDKDGNKTLSTNAVTKWYQNIVSAIIMSHGQVFIWQARDDEIYMHVLHFEKYDVKNDSVFRVSFVFILSLLWPCVLEWGYSQCVVNSDYNA